jgi:hypothetical protein
MGSATEYIMLIDRSGCPEERTDAIDNMEWFISQYMLTL